MQIGRLLLVAALFLSPALVWGQGGNFKAGPFVFDVTGKLGATYSSNISSSNIGKVDDIWFTTGLNARGTWSISKFNELNLGFGLEYRKYLENTQLDSSNTFLTLTPDTELEFNIYAGPLVIVVSDSLQFSSDPAGAVAVDPETNELNYDVLSYSRFVNRAAIQTIWQVNSLHRALFRASRTDVWTLEDEFSNTERTEHALYASLDRIISSRLVVGIYGTRFWNDYWDDFQNDSDGYGTGVTANWKATEFIDFTATAGMRWTDFSASGSNTDGSDFSGTDYSLSVAHVLNSVYSHRLTLGRRMDYGFVSNFTRVHSVDYSFIYEGFKRSDIHGGVTWEDGRDSGGLSPESFERWIFRIGLGYALSSRLTWNLDYHYSAKDSNLSSRDYDGHTFSVFLHYDF